VYLFILAAIALLPCLGSSSRLTYHEAFVAQGAREILSSGNWAYPTIGGLPWLEKPPLPWWLVAVLGHFTGTVDETVARFPSTLAAMGVIGGIGILAARHYGTQVGLLAGAVQATTAWTVIRGRLAEADMLLACLVTWAIIAFDRLLTQPRGQVRSELADSRSHAWCWRWAFLGVLGTSALVKGIGFGAVLILVVVGGIVAWQRDYAALRRLWLPAGWAVAAALGMAWPLLMMVQHGHMALSLWTLHVWARLIRQDGAGLFAGESWGEYIAALLAQALPWTPFALAGARRSLGRAFRGNHTAERSGVVAIPPCVIAGDRLLAVWAVLPLLLLALVPVKNAHYAISVQAPWSIWAALALGRLGTWLQIKGYSQRYLHVAVRVGFIALALTYGLGLWLLGPWFSQRGMEWAFYEAASHKVPMGMRLALFYDDWDRKPYSTPYGSIPHDLAVRLFYLGRSACWHTGPTLGWPTDHILGRCSASCLRVVDRGLMVGAQDNAFAVIGRDRDLPILKQFGHVQVICRGPNVRPDRTYVLFQITPNVDADLVTRGPGMEPACAHVTQ
jgi:4-amino-4-deoxy-L-arabinose transferase-like glycosyltransferase